MASFHPLSDSHTHRHTLIQPGLLCMIFVVGQTRAPRGNLHRHRKLPLYPHTIPPFIIEGKTLTNTSFTMFILWRFCKICAKSRYRCLTLHILQKFRSLFSKWLSHSTIANTFFILAAPSDTACSSLVLNNILTVCPEGFFRF